MRIFGFTEYGGPEVAGFHEVPEPELRPGTVLIETIAVGINPADIKVREGARQSGFPVRFPMAMGREAAGRVVEGASFPRGAVVFGSCAEGVGALGTRTLLDEASVTAVPAGLSPEAAACIPVAVGTAYDAVDELGVGTGERLLVLGAGGGVGVHAVRLARLAGAEVVGVASAGKRVLVESSGARHVVAEPGWADEVRSRFGAVDALVDCVGGDVLREAAAVLPEWPGGIRRLRSLADKDGAVALGGSGVTRRRTAAVFATLADLAASGRFEIAVSDVMDVGNAADGYRVVESGHAEGKIAIRVAGESAADLAPDLDSE